MLEAHGGMCVCGGGANGWGHHWVLTPSSPPSGPPGSGSCPTRRRRKKKRKRWGGQRPLAGPYWEALDWEVGVLLTPCPGWEVLLGLSPSLLASPPPPGPPDEVVRGRFVGAGRVTMCLCPPVQCRHPPQPSSQMSISAHRWGLSAPQCHLPPLQCHPSQCHPQETQLSPQAPAVAPQEAATNGSPATPRVAVGMGGTPCTQGQGAPPALRRNV